MSSTAEPYATFNTLARQAKKYDALPKDRLIELYRQIEAQIYTGVDYLLYNTTFVEDNICYLLAEIQTGSIKSRKSYKGKRTQERVVIGHDIEVGAENRRIFGIGFDIFKLSRVDRRKATPHVRKIIRLMRLNNGFFESILTTFMKETEGYCELQEELAELQTQFDEIPTNMRGKTPETIEMIKRMSELMDRIHFIELCVGTAHPQMLYGTVRVLRHVVKRIRTLQEQVFRAYLRIVLKPVREKALSEAEALDLYQSASLGLARAISLYDYRSGVNFSTFAKNWVTQKIKGSAKSSSGPIIRLPGSVWDYNQKIQAAKRVLERDPDRRYTYNNGDIAAHLKISVKSLERVLEKIELTKVGSLDELIRQQDGLDSDLNRDSTLQDESLEEEQREQEARDRLESILGHIDPDVRKLLCLQNGVLEGIVNTLVPSEVLRETFRQLACKALLHRRAAINAERIIVARSEKISAEEDDV
jgi:RNA polymerase sigma factor (sigma-70 family)